MKKIWNKIESSKILFALFMLIVFFMFIFITNGWHGYIIKGWNGITPYLEGLRNTTSSGYQTFYEVIWIICLIPVLLVFNNKYIFNEKRMSFKETMKIIWPLLLLTSAIGIMMFAFAGGFKYFNFDEVIASIFLYTLVGIFEEFLCRGWLQNEFIERFGKNRSGVVYSLVLSGIIFGCIHFMNFLGGQALGSTIIQMCSAAIAGIYFGAVYFKTKNIWVPVILHGFWDLCLSLAEMNKTMACSTITAETSAVVTAITGILLIVFLDGPEILTSLKILTKSSVNDALSDEYKVEISEEVRNKDKTFSFVLSLIQIIYVCVISVLFLLLGLFGFLALEGDSCLNYKTVTFENPLMTTIKYKDYDFIVTGEEQYVDCPVEVEDSNVDCVNQSMVEKYNLKLKVKDDSLILEYNGKETDLGIDNVVRFAAYEKDNNYIIMALANNDGDGIVYYSDYISIYTLKDSVFVDKFKYSFEMLELPPIYNLGYYGEEKYPLFETPFETYYIMIDGEISKLELK